MGVRSTARDRDDVVDRLARRIGPHEASVQDFATDPAASGPEGIQIDGADCHRTDLRPAAAVPLGDFFAVGLDVLARFGVQARAVGLRVRPDLGTPRLVVRLVPRKGLCILLLAVRLVVLAAVCAVAVFAPWREAVMRQGTGGEVGPRSLGPTLAARLRGASGQGSQFGGPIDAAASAPALSQTGLTRESKPVRARAESVELPGVLGDSASAARLGGDDSDDGSPRFM